MPKKKSTAKEVHTLNHDATRSNIPTAEAQPIVDDETKCPIRVEIERRNPDLDPQLIWRGKSDGPLVVNAPPLYVQEKVHPKHLIEDLVAETKARKGGKAREQLDLFDDFNGVPEGDAKTEFYQHDAHWTNRMILGDSLQVMTSLAERENLRGKVQCVYFDPPYGIKFNSNFQWSTNNRSVKDGKFELSHGEPEQVKAYRDIWGDGVNSYLSNVKSRLEIILDLLSNSGSIFVQIGEDNNHRIRAIMDSVFGSNNFISQISFATTTGLTSKYLPSVNDYILWYAKNSPDLKYNKLLYKRGIDDPEASRYRKSIFFDGSTHKYNPAHLNTSSCRGQYALSDLTSSHEYSLGRLPVVFEGREYVPGKRYWSTSPEGMRRIARAQRMSPENTRIRYRRFLQDYLAVPYTNTWADIGGVQSRSDPKVYVVQTSTSAIQRCILLATDPGDLVLDPTCGSGTTSYVAEQYGRRWITIDTSRVALALARTRIMGARYSYYLLADSKEGRHKEAKLRHEVPTETGTHGDVRQGFVYERVPHITLKSIANNAEIDVIYENFQQKLKPLRHKINVLLGRTAERVSLTDAGKHGSLKDWEIPHEIPPGTSDQLQEALNEWWKLQTARQKEIDASITAKADIEYLYDKPYWDKSKVRVAGPFTVESISPHRMVGVDEYGEVFDQLREEDAPTYGENHDFGELILSNLRVSGVQQSTKEGKILFDSLIAFPGKYVNAEGKYTESDAREVRAAVHIGPEYGSITRPDLVEAAREAAENNFDVLIACGFNYEAHTTEFSKLGRIPVLKARMNADLHMAQDLKATSASNLFVIFGEPDIEVAETEDGRCTVEVRGVDIFDPKTGKVRSDNVDGIACWFVDTNYSGESFFVRHAYFLGAESSYDALKRSLKAEVDGEAWESLHSAVSRPFNKPETGRIAVKIINHLGDEVMKVVKIN